EQQRSPRDQVPQVAGVLVEKAKTTPDVYPMSVNAIRAGCNQKSNRAPLMQLETDDVEESLDRLRQLGAVGIIEGYGRVAKYRHYLYEWLGVDKIELSVMAELLLRGDQTVGELRGRASRMDPIADLAALKTILCALKGKGLIVWLTPEGRGQAVTHALYKPREMETLQQKYSGGQAAQAGFHDGSSNDANIAQPTIAAAPVNTAENNNRVSALEQEIKALRSEMSQAHTDLESLRAEQHNLAAQLKELKEALGG
ncbi:MAG: DUF480 domain-containing protein, partial [Thermoguttaceae bacterium]